MKRREFVKKSVQVVTLTFIPVIPVVGLCDDEDDILPPTPPLYDNPVGIILKDIPSTGSVGKVLTMTEQAKSFLNAGKLPRVQYWK